MSQTKQRRAVFLDRDGVLIEAIVHDNKPLAALCSQDARIIDGVVEACKDLKKLGYFLVLVTNQPDVARGKLKRDVVDGINSMLTARLGLDDVRVCDHDDADNCHCRKPKPGLICDSAAEFSIDLAASYVVGDRWKDVEAGKNAGCKTVFIDYGYDEPIPQPPDYSASSLAIAARWIALQDSVS